MKNAPNPFDSDNFINSDKENFPFVVWNKKKTFGTPLEDKILYVKDSHFDNETGRRIYGGYVIDFVETMGIKLFPLTPMYVEKIPEDQIMTREDYIERYGKNK